MKHVDLQHCGEIHLKTDEFITPVMYLKYTMYSGRTSSWSNTNHCLRLGLYSGPLCVLEERGVSE